MPKVIIMTSDMSMLPPVVAKAVSSQYGHHRFVWFEDVLNYISNYFVNIFGDDYQSLLLTSTLVGAKEALDFDNFKVKDISYSLGVDDSSFDDKSVDAYIIAPEGSLMGIAGTAIVVIRKDAIPKLKTNVDKLPYKPYLLDIVNAYNVWEKKQTTPYSPNISAVVALAAALQFTLDHGGLAKNVERHIKIASFIRNYLGRNNFDIIDASLTNAFTVCKVPKNIKADDLVESLAQENIFVDLLDEQTIKIGHFGYISYQSLDIFIKALDKILQTSTDLSWQEIKEYAFDESSKDPEIILNSATEKLLTPGPTYFNPEIFDVMENYTYYKSKKFIKDFLELSDRLSVWMGAHNPTLTLSGPSTGLMEAAISNLTRAGDRGLIISHGKFGDRWTEICQAKNRDYLILKVADEDWGQAFSAKEIDDFIAKQDKQIDFICFQQNETSSGVAYNQKQIEEISKVVRRHNSNIIIIMDFVSGSFAHDINFDEVDIDAAIIGSQKGLGISSGVAFLNISDRAIRRLLDLIEYSGSLSDLIKEETLDKYLDFFEKKQQVHYLNILRLLTDLHKKNITDMPNVFHIYSALKSLDSMDKLGGRDYFINRHAKLAKKTRDYVENKLGLKILGDKDYLSNSVSLVLFPENIDAVKIKKTLKEQYGFSVAGAQSDYWKSKFIRVGHLGYVDEKTIDDFLQSLAKVLKDYK
ncbi:MAG: aminotransferase class V-fold PLP-dependent enzyme [Patescibacteria group bacterium]